MGLKLEVPADVQRAYAKQRVTLPSVTPSARFQQDSAHITKQFTDDAVKEAEWKRNDATQKDNGRPRDEIEAQMGRVFTGSELGARLKKLNPSIYFEDSPRPERILIKHNQKTIAAMERGHMPEFSVIDIPKEKWIEPREVKRGWRTVLGKCLLGGLFGLDAVEREFGLPTYDSAQWYRVKNNNLTQL